MLPFHLLYCAQRGFCPALRPTGGWALHSAPTPHPRLTPGLACFFPGAAVGLSLCDAGLEVPLATGAWGCRLGSTPSRDPFGMFAQRPAISCHGLSCTQQNTWLPFTGYMPVSGKHGGNAKCAALVHAWHRVQGQGVGTWHQGFNPGMLHRSISPLHSQAVTAQQQLLVMLITDHRDEVRAVCGGGIWACGGKQE